MEFKQETIKKGPLSKVGVKIVLPEADTSTRGMIRKKINEEVGDVYSLLADSSELISLLMSTVGVLYSAQTQETLDRIPADKRAFIEYSMKKFTETTTTADNKFAIDPEGTVNKLLDSQGTIGTIVSTMSSK